MTLRALVDSWHRASRQSRAEVRAAVAGVTGWVLITWALAAWLDWRVWPASIGVLLMTGPGLRTVAVLLWTGSLGLGGGDDSDRREG